MSAPRRLAEPPASKPGHEEGLLRLTDGDLPWSGAPTELLPLHHRSSRSARTPLAAGRLDRFTALDVRRLLAELGECGRANNTLHHVGACLRTALNEAVSEGLMPQGNVAMAARIPPLRRVEYETWDAHEVRTFMAAAASDEFEALYALAITTGARQGELFALRRSAFDLRTGTVSIQASVSRRRQRTLTKNASSVRLVDLDPVVVDLVADHLGRRPVELRADPLVFPHPVKGGMLDNSFLYVRRFKPLVARAGLRPIRFHDLRHTAARLMLEGGLLPHEVGRILGHSDPSTTLRLYAPWIRLNRPDVARVMGAVLNGPPVDRQVMGPPSVT